MPLIARRVGADYKTVRRNLRADSAEELIAGGVRTSNLDPFKPYLHQQLAAGVRNATRLFAEIAQLGYAGSYPVVERYLQPLRRADAGHPRPRRPYPAAAGAADQPHRSPACPATS